MDERKKAGILLEEQKKAGNSNHRRTPRRNEFLSNTTPEQLGQLQHNENKVWDAKKSVLLKKVAKLLDERKKAGNSNHQRTPRRRTESNYLEEKPFSQEQQKVKNMGQLFHHSLPRYYTQPPSFEGLVLPDWIFAVKKFVFWALSGRN